MAQAQRPSFETLIAPLSATEFFASIWDQEPLLLPQPIPGGADSLLTLDELDGYLRRPAFFKQEKVQLRSSTPPHARRASSLAEVYEGLAKGQSLQVLEPHRFLPPDHPLQGMVASLERTLGQPLTLGAIFLSPAGAQGLLRHHDVLDLFTLQLAGRKRWHLFERLPMEAIESETPDYGDEPGMTLELSAGEGLYLPRGIPHEVLAADETSLSVGLGFRPATWAMILERATAALLKAPEFAPPVPPRAEETLDQERIRAMVHALRARLDALEPDHVREALADLSLASGPPREAEPHLEQALSATVVEADAWLRKRRGMQARVRTQGEQVRLDFSGGEGVAAPLAAQPTLAALVDCQHAFRPCDLPGPLRAEAKATLARKLLRVGFLRRATAPSQ